VLYIIELVAGLFTVWTRYSTSKAFSIQTGMNYFFPRLRSMMDCVGCMSNGLSTGCESSIIVVTSGFTGRRGGADVVEVTTGIPPVPRSIVCEALEDMVLVRDDARSSSGVGSAWKVLSALERLSN
jgi:hypothetical protein